MRRFLSLLLALMLLPLCATAEEYVFEPTDDAVKLYRIVKEVFEAEELVYDAYDDYVYLAAGFQMDDDRMGEECLLYVDVYDDFLLLTASLETPIPEEKCAEVLQLCTLISSDIFFGKFYLTPEENILTYEMILLMDPDDVRPFDRENIVSFLYTLPAYLDEFLCYFMEILENDLPAEHAFAIYLADYDE